MNKPKLSPAAEKRLRDEVKKLSDDWFEHDSGDGFGRATDEEIEHIANFITDEIARERKDVLGEVEKAIELTDKYEYRGRITPQSAKEQTLDFIKSVISKLKHEK